MFNRHAFEQGWALARQKRKEEALAAGFERLRQAAVPLERLTGSEHWDTFLRLGEAMQERDRAALLEAAERLSSTEYLPPEHLARWRHRALTLQAAIQAREELLALPRSILQNGLPESQVQTANAASE